MKTPDYRITTTEADEGHILEIVIEGDLGLKNAGRIYKALRMLKTSCGTVNLKLKNVGRLDITTLQTVRVFRNMLSEQGKSLKAEAELGEEVQGLLRNSGFSTIL